MEILHQVDLSQHNSMALPCLARKVIRVHSKDELSGLQAALDGEDPFILGGGSNVILPPRLDRPVLQFLDETIAYTALNESSTLVEVSAGVEWDFLVKECASKDLRGIENLSLIPGLVGAAPVQNIGAYGVELADVLSYVEVYDWKTQSVRKLERDQCQFAYRDSLFKQKPGCFLIVGLGLTLSKTADFVLGYGELTKLENQKNITAMDVRNEIIRIRQSKLPDPKILPNSGSFFKNPVVKNDRRDVLLGEYSNLVSYPVNEDQSKLAAGWLIDCAGWKGLRQGDVGVHEKQALVLVNYGASTQQDVLSLAGSIQKDILDKFEVKLEIEPVVLDAS